MYASERKKGVGAAPQEGRNREMTTKTGYIIVQCWDDAEVVVGPGNHIFTNEEEAVQAHAHVCESWEKEVAKDIDAEWIKHTGKPSLRNITWTVVDEEAAGDAGAKV